MSFTQSVVYCRFPAWSECTVHNAVAYQMRTPLMMGLLHPTQLICGSTGVRNIAEHHVCFAVTPRAQRIAYSDRWGSERPLQFPSQLFGTSGLPGLSKIRCPWGKISKQLPSSVGDALWRRYLPLHTVTLAFSPVASPTLTKCCLLAPIKLCTAFLLFVCLGLSHPDKAALLYRSPMPHLTYY